MSTRIKTNKLCYSIDRGIVSSKYDFFAIETCENHIKHGASILDSTAFNDSIKSILFDKGRKALVMMPHNPDNREMLKAVIRNTEGGDKLSFATCNVSSIADNDLLQLLLNALSSYDSEILRFNNITGHFFCFHPAWIEHGKLSAQDIIWKVHCLELRITSDLCLANNVRTFSSVKLKNEIVFTKRKFEDYPQYIFSNRNTLRRKLSGDRETGFIMRQTGNCKKEIPFLEIQNSKKYSSCKVGVINKVIEIFNKQYEGFVHIEMAYEEVTARVDCASKTIRENTTKVKELLSSKSIFVIDQIGDDFSGDYCSDLVDTIRKKYGIDAKVGKRVRPEGFNICLIHNQAHYVGMDDPHDKDYEASVQHVTYEDFSENSEFAIATVVHEVIIKDDLQNGKISLFDWNSLGFTEDMLFGIEDKSDDEERFFFMCVHPDGSFKIEEKKFDLFEMNDYYDCVQIFEEADLLHENVRGIIKDSAGNRNIIKDTGMITYPEADEIKALLNQGDNRLRGKAPREKLMSAILDIKLFEKDGAQYYFAGTVGDGMQNSIPRAANIRKIESYAGAPLMFERLLPLMKVFFVHNGQLTVLPFPFKYLREYVRLKSGKKDGREKNDSI